MCINAHVQKLTYDNKEIDYYTAVCDRLLGIVTCNNIANIFYLTQILCDVKCQRILILWYDMLFG